MSVLTDFRQLTKDVGELLARHESTRDVESFARYRDDPCGFLVDVLRADPWQAQRELAELVRDEPRVVCRSANGCGKGWLGARLLLWWCYARQGLAIVTAPTLRQVRAVLMRELRSSFALCGELPGELYEESLRVDDARQIGVLAFTSNEASRWQGIHHPELLILVDEGQGCEPDVFEAVAACQPARTLVMGNPLFPVGTFYSIAHSDGWRSFKISAADHPNIVEGKTVIPGGITREWQDTMADLYGRDSAFYISRVEGEFPLEGSADSLISRAWLRRAVEAHESNAFAAQAFQVPPVLALDPARYGSDSTALAIAHGPIISEIIVWHHASLTDSADRLIAHAKRVWPKQGRGPAPRLVVDGVGVGAGIVDEVRKQGWQCRDYNAGAKAIEERRFANARSEALWCLRALLETGKLALPADAMLEEEALAVQWQATPNGRVQILAKDTMRTTLGRSPDRLDAVMMAVAHGIGGLRRQVGVSTFRI